ncbi:Hemolysin-type calcium-binding region [hydrothermal vent metagenome]|uniref:Hemolysin-type calcium-binding region n=1 Tax=hydrothermal vent metagenome TaxID=652676 RepID=A0A1W1D5A5_9ZZZZ
MAKVVGVILSLHGDVYVQSKDGIIRRVHTGDKIFADDLVKTFGESTVDIRLDNGKILSVDGNKELLVDKSVYSEEQFAQKDVNADNIQEQPQQQDNQEGQAQQEDSANDIQTAAGKKLETSHLNRVEHSTTTTHLFDDNNSIADKLQSTNTNENMVDYGSVSQVSGVSTMDLDIEFPEPPKIAIDNFNNRSGDFIGATFTFSKDTKVGDILSIENPNGTHTNLTITQDMIENGYHQSYIAPSDGSLFEVKATIIDSDGYASDTVKAGTLIDTTYGDGEFEIEPSVDITQVDSDGKIDITGVLGSDKNSIESITITDKNGVSIDVDVHNVRIEGSHGYFKISGVDVDKLAYGDLRVSVIAIDSDGNQTIIRDVEPKSLDDEAPDAPIVTINDDMDHDGTVNFSDLQEDKLSTTITFGEGTEVGGELILVVNSASQEGQEVTSSDPIIVEITQDMIENGYTTTLPLPVNATEVSIDAQVVDRNGNTSEITRDNLHIVEDFKIEFLDPNADHIINAHELSNTSIQGVIAPSASLESITLSQGDKDVSLDIANVDTSHGRFIIPNIDLSMFDDGEITLSASVVDKDGKPNTLKDVATIDTVYGEGQDGDLPQISIIDSDGDGIVNSQELSTSTLRGTIGENGVSLDRIEVVDSKGTATLSISNIDIQPDGTYEIPNFDFSHFEDGPITVIAYSTDKEGNTASTSTQITLDTLAPVVTVVQDENHDGVLNASEVADSIDAKIILGRNAQVGQTLIVHNPDGSDSEFAITQDMIDNGYIQSFDAPKEGESITIGAAVKAEDGTLSESKSSTLTLTTDTIYGDDIDNDGSITPPTISFVDDDNVLNQTEATNVKLSGSVGEGGKTIDAMTISDGQNSVSVNVDKINVALDGTYEIRGIDLSSLSDTDKLEVTVNTTDRDGNTAKTKSTITLDRVYGNDLDGDGSIDAPTAHIQDEGGDGIVNFKELQSSTLSGNVGEDGASIESIVVVDGFKNELKLNTKNVEMSDDGSYVLKNIDLSSLEDGNLTVYTTFTDVNGNTKTVEDTISKDSILNVSFDNLDLTGDTTPRFNGTMDGDVQKVVIDVDGEKHTAQIDPEHGTWTLKWPTRLSHGEHHATVTATDDAGNEVTVKELDGFMIDSQINATIDSVTEDSADDIDFITNDNTVIIKGTIDGDVDTLEVRVDSHVYTLNDPELTINDGHWQLDLSKIELPDKEYQVTAEYIDHARNASQVTKTMVIDTNEVIKIDPFTHDNTTNDRVIKLTGSTENATDVLVVIKDDNGNEVFKGDANVDEYGNWEILTTKLGDNEDKTDLTLEVKAIDEAGNVEIVKQDFTIDPKVITVSVDEVDMYTNTLNPTITGSVVGADKIDITIKDGDDVVWEGTVEEKDIDKANNKWSITLDGDGLKEYKDGYSIEVKASNAATDKTIDGITISAQDPDDSDVKVDITQIDGKDVSDDTQINNPTGEIKGTISGDVTKVVVSVDGASFDADVDSEHGTWSVNIPSDIAISDGKYDLQVVAYNKYGNNADDKENFTLDTKPPMVTIDDMEPTNDQSPTLTGTISPDTDKVILQIGSQRFEADIDHDNNTWSLEWPNNLAEGSYRVYAEAYDALGNGIREHNEFLISGVEKSSVSHLDITTDFHATPNVDPKIEGTYNKIDDIIVKINGEKFENGDLVMKNGHWSWQPTGNYALHNGVYQFEVIGIRDGKETIYAHTEFEIDQNAQYNAASDGANEMEASEGYRLFNDAPINDKGTAVVSIASEHDGTNSTSLDGREFTTSLGGKVVVNADGTFEYTAPILKHSADEGSKQDYFYFKESDGTNTSDWKRFEIDVFDAKFGAENDARDVGYEGVVGGNLIDNDQGSNIETPEVVKVTYKGEDYTFDDTTDNAITIDADYGTLTVDRNGEYQYKSNIEVPVITTSVGSEDDDTDSDTYGADGYDITLKGFNDTSKYLETDNDGNPIGLKLDEVSKADDDEDTGATEKETDKDNEKYAGVDSGDSSSGYGSKDTSDVINNVDSNNNEGMVVDFKEARYGFDISFAKLDDGEKASVKVFDKDGKFIKEFIVDGDDNGVSIAKNEKDLDGKDFRYISFNAIDSSNSNSGSSYGSYNNSGGTKSEFGIDEIKFIPVPKEVDNFSYTIKDSDTGKESSADVTFKYTFDQSANPDNAYLDEAGLDNGTNPDIALITASGNLLENDSGLSGEKVSEVNGVKLENGVVTLENDQGILEVHDNGDYTYKLKSATTYLENDDISFTYKLDNDLESTLDIHVKDDKFAPTNLEEYSITSSSTHDVYNITLVIDKSGSLSLGAGLLDDVNKTKMDITKEAINSILDKYSQMGEVNINIIDFSDKAQNSGWILDDDNSAKDYINFIEPNGGSNYANALEEVMATSANAPQANHNILYFVTDGASSEDSALSDSLLARWNEFRDATFSEINGISFEGDTQKSHSVMQSIVGENGNNIAVNSVNDLSAALHYTVHTDNSISGDLTGGKDFMFDFGADGGYIKSVTIDGTTHTFDKNSSSLETGSPIQTFTTKLGGIFSINFLTGEYSYQANTAQNQSGEHESFHFVAVDNDGDIASSTLKIDLDTFANLDTNNDIIITNKTQGNIDIPAWTLLNNDNQGYNLHIDSFDKAKYMDINFDKTSGMFSLEGYDDYVSPFGTGEIGQVNINQDGNEKNENSGDSFDKAIELSREEFGYLSSAEKDLVKDATMPTMRVNGTLDSDHTEEFVKVKLQKGEWLVLDIDNGYDMSKGDDGDGDSVDTTLTLYDADGNEIAMNEEAKVVSGGTGSNYKYDPFLSYHVQEDGEYYVKVSAGSHDGVGNYTLMTSILPTFDKMGFEYNAVDDLGRESSSLVDFMRTASQTLIGDDRSEVFISNDNDAIIDAKGGDDAILGGIGNDIIDGGSGDDSIKGGEGDDVIDGGSGEDIIEGGAGKDTIDGGSGHDLIDGGAGEDMLQGGKGSDTFVYDTQDKLVDGGADTDSILVHNNIDFTQLDNVKNIETIDMHDGADEHITLDVDAIIDMTDDKKTITIYGDDSAKDEVTIKNGDGEWSYKGQEVDKDNHILNIYEQDGATIKIDEDIRLDFE